MKHSAMNLAEIEQRYRQDPNMYWVAEVEWLIIEVKRLRTALEELSEHCTYCCLDAKAMADEALGKP